MTRLIQRRIIPEPVTGYELNPARGWVEVVLADGTQNLARNPSFELNTTGAVKVGTTTTLSLTTDYQRRGARALTVTPDTGVNDGFYYDEFRDLVAGSQYWVGFDFHGAGGLKYKAYFATNAGVLLGAPIKFTATGRWQRLHVNWKETTSVDRRLYIVKDNSANVQPFYVDGILIEQKERWTTYADGDMAGLIPNFDDFYWLGAPHASESIRVDNSAAGGRVYNLKQFGFRLMSIVGLGLSAGGAVFSPVATGGAIYQGSTLAARQFTLVGDMSGGEWQELGMRRMALTDLFKPDRVSPQQPVILRYTPCDDAGRVTGDTLEIPCVLSEDPDNPWDNVYSNRIGLTFTLYLPFVGRAEGDAGADLSYQVPVPNANYIVYQDTGGAWHSVNTGADSTGVYALTAGLDGKIYIGGLFAQFDGVANTNGVAVYDPTTGNISALGTGLAAAGYCQSLDTDVNGNIWCTGFFNDAGGVADTKHVAIWDVQAQAWVSVGTGGLASGGSNCVYAAPDGSVYLTTVNASTVGGVSVQGVGKYTAGTWTDFGDAAFNEPQSITFSNGYFYLSDREALPNPAKIWRRTPSGSWTDIADSINGSGANIPAKIGVGLNGKIYLTSNGDLGTDLIHGIAEYDGVGLSELDAGVTGQIEMVLPLENGNLLVGGNGYSFGNVNFPDSLAVWNSSAFVPVGIDLPSTAAIQALLYVRGFGTVIGYQQAGTAIAESVQTVTNAGSANAYPRFSFKGPGPLYFVKNYTTSQAVYFNLTLLDGETAVLDFTDPLNVTFTSDFRGNILNTIMPGSSFDFFLKPGDNAISVFLNWDRTTTVYNDGSGQFSSFQLIGINGSTSEDGKVFVTKQDVGPVSKLIQLWADSSLTNLIAYAFYSATGMVTLSEQVPSGVTGTVDVDSLGPDDADIYIDGFPIVTLTWRNTHASADGVLPGRLVR